MADVEDKIRTAVESMELDLKGMRPVSFMSIQPYWLRSFAMYNEHNKPMLNTNCSACYMRVFLFMKVVNSK